MRIVLVFPLALLLSAGTIYLILETPSGDFTEAKTAEVVRAEKDSHIDSLESEDNQVARVLELYSPFCASCMKMKPVLEQLATDCRFANVHVDFVDISVEENEHLLDHYNVGAVPTFLFLDEQGVETARLVGMQTETNLREALSVLKGDQCGGLTRGDRNRG